MSHIFSTSSDVMAVRQHRASRVARDENGANAESAARDVVQETSVRVYFGARKFKPKASVKTWMYFYRVLERRWRDVRSRGESGACAETHARHLIICDHQVDPA